MVCGGSRVVDGGSHVGDDGGGVAVTFARDLEGWYTDDYSSQAGKRVCGARF